MIFAMGGTAEGEISIRSSPAVLAAARAASSDITPKFPPSALITRNSVARISLFILSRSVAKGELTLAQIQIKETAASRSADVAVSSMRRGVNRALPEALLLCRPRGEQS